MKTKSMTSFFSIAIAFCSAIKVLLADVFSLFSINARVVTVSHIRQLQSDIQKVDLIYILISQLYVSEIQVKIRIPMRFVKLCSLMFWKYLFGTSIFYIICRKFVFTWFWLQNQRRRGAAIALSLVTMIISHIP